VEERYLRGRLLEPVKILPVAAAHLRAERAGNRDLMVELASSQMTALGASNFRTANNPVNTNGTQAGSPAHDLAGEAAGVSN
jgi:hypothetical protein